MREMGYSMQNNTNIMEIAMMTIILVLLGILFSYTVGGFETLEHKFDEGFKKVELALNVKKPEPVDATMFENQEHYDAYQDYERSVAWLAITQ